jgi:predicted nucleic acid-binding protein
LICKQAGLVWKRVRKSLRKKRNQEDFDASKEEIEKLIQQHKDREIDLILNFDKEAAQVWGHLRVPNHEHVIDKQIAAIALTNGLIVVIRNTDDFESSGVKLLNPFTNI